jgi:hypothetical protein
LIAYRYSPRGYAPGGAASTINGVDGILEVKSCNQAQAKLLSVITAFGQA